ncbi:MAG: hypothetical protein PHR30_04115 [Gallionellaceae bacterium]|nr:hypothetical protein [Gallionellaceae bacterium]MDD5364501.1 hypothetical protein [Gallionellaceae bacterium]
MRVVLFLLSLVVAGCTARINTIGASRPEVLRDVEGYAVASCLANQTQPYLKDQGDAWASVIVQRMKGRLDVLASISEQVKRESAKGEMAVIRDDVGPAKDKTLPVLYCGEIIDRPSVRAEIQKAVAELNPSYEQ